MAQQQPIPNHHRSVVEQVVEDLQERMRVGVATYGTPLQPYNGRNSLQDLYEELLDAACYVKQRLIEQEAQEIPEGHVRITFDDGQEVVGPLSYYNTEGLEQVLRFHKEPRGPVGDGCRLDSDRSYGSCNHPDSDGMYLPHERDEY